MRRDNLLLIVKKMNEASQLSSHAAEYVVMAAELAYSEGERQGRVDALEDAKKEVEAATWHRPSRPQQADKLDGVPTR